MFFSIRNKDTEPHTVSILWIAFYTEEPTERTIINRTITVAAAEEWHEKMLIPDDGLSRWTFQAQTEAGASINKTDDGGGAELEPSNGINLHIRYGGTLEGTAVLVLPAPTPTPNVC